MKKQVEFVPGMVVDPIPEPFTQVRRLMLATSMLVEGHLDTQPEHFDTRLRNCFLVRRAGIIIAGTRCARPLITREIINVGRAVERDAIVVRYDDERDGEHVTFDVHPFGSPEKMLGYRLWMPQPVGPAWLIPTAGEGAFVRFDPNGIEVSHQQPFADCFDRQRGLVWASQFMSVATKGWF